MDEIPEIKRGTFAPSSVVNRLIRFINAMRVMTVREGSASETPKLVLADRKFELITTLGETAEGGGGIPEGFKEETFDVVEDDNTAGQRIFLTKEVP